MPLLTNSSYQAPSFLPHGHLQTIFAYYRRIPDPPVFQRERFFTTDGDFLDLDWLRASYHTRLAILSHGLEGHSRRPYVSGMAKALFRANFDILAWNYRGCSEEINWNLRFYHSGDTEDIHQILHHGLAQKAYHTVILIGFSIGGNITLKYLGEGKKNIPSEVKKAVAFSVPCDLRASSRQLARPANQMYTREFLRCFHRKVWLKQRRHPDRIHDRGFHRIKNFHHFDERYTAPLNGFQNALDYWQKSSCKQFLPNITIPTLLVNARNDPFLTPTCFPIQEAKQNSQLYLEMPEQGGHVGFVPKTQTPCYWSEERTLEFIIDI